MKQDIDRAHEALQAASNFRIHTFIATSDLHMKYKLRLSKEQVLENIGKSVKYARNLCDDVEWSAEDGSRSNFDFLCKCIETSYKKWCKNNKYT